MKLACYQSSEKEAMRSLGCSRYFEGAGLNKRIPFWVSFKLQGWKLREPKQAFPVGSGYIHQPSRTSFKILAAV